ncbi:hypothetical protein HHK36_014622 [Tetracentron sinense]|uniref:Uncharacterized protein n=1 Tax=Tetracentron sinense TaxID=13715 RepID=A0A835DG03_TETSI|nr:hypothetical protein HHK36_014622 [Tetracentron sinense]
MEEVLIQSETMTNDITASVVLDIESLAQSSDKCSGSPKMSRALSRKATCRMERRCGVEEEEIDEPPKRLLVRVSSQLEPPKQSLITSKALTPVTTTLNGSNFIDPGDGRSKRFNRFFSLNPRKILLIFATVSCMGTLILIYFTLAINRPG